MFNSSSCSRPANVALAFVLVALSAGCPKEEPLIEPEPEAGETCAVDLSRDVNTATPLTLGEPAGCERDGDPIPCLLCPAFDADFFSFSVDAPGSIVVVKLSMETAFTPLDPAYSIFHADGTPVEGATGRHENRSSGEPVNFEGAHSLDTAGDYVIRIADVELLEDRTDITNPYTLVVDVIPNPDANEPNDNADSATVLTPGAAATGLIGTTGDEDWYAIPVEADAQLLDVVVTAPSGSGVDHRIDVYDKDGRTLLDRRDLVTDPDLPDQLRARAHLAARGSSGDAYYVRVFSVDETQAQIDPTIGSFEIVATLTADPDPQESAGGNNTPATATAASSGDVFTAALAARGDQDYYVVNVPAGITSAAPKVLVASLTVDGSVGDSWQPQLRIVGYNPEVDQIPTCDDSCPIPCISDGSGGEGCGQTRLQRLALTGSKQVGFPLRDSRPVYVAVNDFLDDQFQEGAGYSLSIEVVDDLDPGERGDDYLLPNLETIAIENADDPNNDIEQQYARSVGRARDVSFPFLQTCEFTSLPTCPVVDGGFDVGAGEGPDGGPSCAPPPAEACAPVEAVPSPGPGGQIGYTAVCTGQDDTVQIRGRLSYDGDRDYFRFDLPAAGYWALDTTYSTSATSPVELTVFFHNGSGEVISSFLEAQQTASIGGGRCESSQECEPGSVCIDRTCWADRDDNPAVSGKTFPGNSGGCSYVHVNDPRPIIVEVTDNGINDFDLAMEYTLNVRVRCGCPAACNGGFDACQGVPPPQ